jgi:competence protein ComEC
VKKYILAISMIFILLFGGKINAQNEWNEVHFLDVGQSDCILIKGKEKKYLIDTGFSGNYSKIIDYLNTQGVNKLDQVIITHYHDDHYGGLEGLTKNISIDKIILPKHQSKYRDFLFSYLQGKNIKVESITEDFEVKGNNIYLKALLANEEDMFIENNNGTVLVGTIDGIKYAFMADVEKEREKEILNNEEFSRSEVIKVPHHALDTSSTEDLIKFVKPKIAVITCDGNESPSKEIISRYEEDKAVVFRTDMHGDIIIKVDAKNKDIEITSSKVIK